MDAAKSGGTKTLLELIETLNKETPSFDAQVAELLQNYPELVGPDSMDPIQKRYRTNFRLGRLVAIFTMNFLCRAYDRPDLGYKPTGSKSPNQN
jgi:hypothetical protein